MLRLPIATVLCLLSASGIVFAGDQEDVHAAAQKLAESKSYSWTTTSEGGGGGGGGGGGWFGAGGASGQIQPDGLTLIVLDLRDAPARVFLKGDKAAVETPDEGWRSLDVESDGGERREERREERRQRDRNDPNAPNAPGAAGGPGAGPGPGDRRDPMRMIGGLLRNYQPPAVQAAHLASVAQDVTKNPDGSYTATLSGDEARALMQRRVGRRMGDGQGQGPGGAGAGAGAGGRGPGAAPEVKDPHATVTFWTDGAGQLTRFQFHVTGTMTTRDGQERPIDRTTTVEFNDIGTTKIDLPEEAKAKLES